MRLNVANIKAIAPADGLLLPRSGEFDMPEKVLLFGTGVFVRGLIVYLIDRANKQGIFNGRVIMVKSTNSGGIDQFRAQDNLYTLVMKSRQNNTDLEERVVCSAISRVLEARCDWPQILACAVNKDLKIIVSNTTEVGIVLDTEDSPSDEPPRSYPMKLLAFLQARYSAFNGSSESGMVIIPTELIPDNARLLKGILNTLAVKHGMDQSFINWMNDCNDFCSSLVDRIVPGKITGKEQMEIQQQLGYEDDLMVMGETFGLWAIETCRSRTVELLSFSKAFPAIYVVPNIDKFRELKLRLLNGSHNLSCAVGFLAGFETVKEAMANELFDAYMQRLILQDIAKAIISDEILLADASDFGEQVLARYRNPFIAFNWLSICVQDTSKIRIRAVPVVLRHAMKYGHVPKTICMAFAAYLLFMKSERLSDGSYQGTHAGQTYPIADDFAGLVHDYWKHREGVELVQAVFEDKVLWGDNLAVLPGFVTQVSVFLDRLITQGFTATLQQILENE